METITHSNQDFIISRWDKIHILEKQANVLVKHLPNWVVGKQKPNPNANLYSPILSGLDNFNTEVEVAKEGIHKFIQELNSNGDTVSRIVLWIYQSNDMDALPHPSNGPLSGDKFYDNQDFKYVNYIFDDIFKEENHQKQTIFINKFDREYNKRKSFLKKKYFVLVLESPWASL